MSVQLTLEGFNDDVIVKRLTQIGECYLDGWFFYMKWILSKDVVIESYDSSKHPIIGYDAALKAYNRLRFKVKKHELISEIVLVTKSNNDSESDLKGKNCLFVYHMFEGKRIGVLYFIKIDEQEKINSAARAVYNTCFTVFLPLLALFCPGF